LDHYIPAVTPNSTPKSIKQPKLTLSKIQKNIFFLPDKNSSERHLSGRFTVDYNFTPFPAETTPKQSAFARQKAQIDITNQKATLNF